MCGKYSLTKFANFLIIVLRTEIATIFKAESGSNNEKICKLCKAIFSTHYNIFQPNFGILLLFKGSFRECSFFLEQKLVYKENCLLSIEKSFHKLVARVLPGFPNT